MIKGSHVMKLWLMLRWFSYVVFVYVFFACFFFFGGGSFDVVVHPQSASTELKYALH